MNALVPSDANGAMQLATMMATGKLIPGHLQRNAGDCLLVIEQAMRWGMSPFAVAQCTAVIHGRLMFEGKLVAAAVNTSGVLSGRLSYDFGGDGDAREITVRGTIKGEGQPREITVKLKDAKTTNEHWKKSPDQMLAYHAARVWARRHVPEVMLGVYSPDEFEAESETQKDNFSGVTIEADSEPSTSSDPLKEPNGTKWMKNLDVLLHQASSEDEVQKIADHPSVKKAKVEAPSTIKGLIDDYLTQARSRLRADEDAANEPEPDEVDDFLAKLTKISVTEVERLDTSPAHKSWLRSLSPEDQGRVNAAVADRMIARMGA